LARQVKALADKARSGKLEPNDVTGSTFTHHQPGSVRIVHVSTGHQRPEHRHPVDRHCGQAARGDHVGGREDVLAIRHIGYLGLTWDHRAFDGSTAVLFLARIKHNLENWDWEQEMA
jgi:pyruvate dehydrogenase E2 component (dihydrolipoamide acetyltransferase)